MDLDLKIYFVVGADGESSKTTKRCLSKQEQVKKLLSLWAAQRQTVIKESLVTVMVFGLPQKSMNTMIAQIPGQVLSRLQAGGRLPHSARSPFGI